VPRDPYVALWSRLDRFRPQALAEPIAARWRAELDGDRTTLWIEPFSRIARSDRAEMSEEGERLAAFLAPDAGRRDVRFRAFRGTAPSR
jgi:hypothetical protein